MNTPDAYSQTLAYLYERLPMFSRIGSAAIKKDLTNTILLCEASGNPQKAFKSIHIAGTNGKGSTSHMLAAIFQACGYKTGLYTSPHLFDFRERIRINGEPVREEFVVDYVAQHKEEIERIEPSFFEITVAMAFTAFTDEKVDIAIIETGLGGRLDSTNVIIPELSVITNISYDHMDLLGNTLPDIAREKAGIIKPGVPVLIGEEGEETGPVFIETARKNGSPLYYAGGTWDIVRIGMNEGHQHFKAVHRGRGEIYDVYTDLLGTYQQHNIKTVLAAAALMEPRGWQLPLPKILEALKNVAGITGFHGRYERMGTDPLIIADVAHNPAGLKEVLAQWGKETAAKKYILTGFVKDKDVAEALTLFPKDNYYFFTNAAIPRALPAETLSAMAKEAGLQGDTYNSVKEAVAAVQKAMQADDALLITGSFFVVGEAMEYLDTDLP